jgi:hypothetical protein
MQQPQQNTGDPKITFSLYPCLLCDGYQYTCRKYHPTLQDNDYCIWATVIDKDLAKLARGQHDLTFGELEDILRGESKYTMHTLLVDTILRFAHNYTMALGPWDQKDTDTYTLEFINTVLGSKPCLPRSQKWYTDFYHIVKKEPWRFK